MFHIRCSTSIKNLLGKALGSRLGFTSHAIHNTYAVENLMQRGLLRVQGNDVYNFLQGLMTNDINHLEKANSVYTLFLNVKGRVMCDSVIYKTQEQNVLLLECDTSSVEFLHKHLKIYRVRRKIDIVNVSEEQKVWAIFRPINVDVPNITKVDYSASEASIPNEIIEFMNENNAIVCRDPRLISLGFRVIASSNTDVHAAFVKKFGSSMCYNGGDAYKTHRYILGIGEGTEDLSPGVSFPLEVNCDYLHGVSFHKGCYIGQELTARTYHTGVIRKRLMPILFDSKPEIEFALDCPIHSSELSKKALGKLRAVEGRVGLALLRISEVLSASKLNVMGCTGETSKPKWWPQEAPKDRITLSREA